MVALDVAYGELSWRLRVDPRVTVIERFNARPRPGRAPVRSRPDGRRRLVHLAPADPRPAPRSAAAPRFDALLLIKPQFEVGRGLVGRGGVVREPALRRRALLEVADAAVEAGAAFRGFFASGLPGPKGNLETFVALAEPGRGSLPDLESYAREVEPG